MKENNWHMLSCLSWKAKQLTIAAYACSIIGLFVLSIIYIAKYVTDETLNLEQPHFYRQQKNNTEIFHKLSFQEPILDASKINDLSTRYDIAVTYPSIKWTEKDLQFFNSAAGEAVFSQLTVITQENALPNFVSMTAAERLFKSLYNYFDEMIAYNPQVEATSDPSWKFYKRLEKSLYPWLAPYWQNAFHINNQTEGKGIVICVGNDQFRLAVATVQAIREIHKCELPIEIFIIDEYDLSKAKKTYFEAAFDNVKIRNLYRSVDNYYLRFGGWAMKPFALLASNFTEVLVMDSDAFFLQTPEKLFDDPAYKLTGSLFFYDRTLFPDWRQGSDWMRSFLTTMSDFARRTRWFTLKSKHEQESGVVVMNKKQALLGLLAICRMNSANDRDQVVYKSSWGDKETFWIGHEIMQTPYAFVKSFGAVIGNFGRGGKDGADDTVCGVQLHMDPKNKPLWFNNGIYRNKHDVKKLEYLNFTLTAQGDDWDFDTYCLNDKDKIRKTSTRIERITQMMIDYDKFNMANRTELMESRDPYKI